MGQQMSALEVTLSALVALDVPGKSGGGGGGVKPPVCSSSSPYISSCAILECFLS